MHKLSRQPWPGGVTTRRISGKSKEQACHPKSCRPRSSSHAAALGSNLVTNYSHRLVVSPLIICSRGQTTLSPVTETRVGRTYNLAPTEPATMSTRCDRAKDVGEEQTTGLPPQGCRPRSPSHAPALGSKLVSPYSHRLVVSPDMANSATINQSLIAGTASFNF